MIMRYKNYIGKVTYDEDEKLFYGEKIGMKDMITFQGRSVEELEQAIKDSVEVYIEWCKERGKVPQKSFSGQLRIRINPKLHARLAQEASLMDKSLNSYIEDKLSK